MIQRVLIVDDNEALAENLGELLELEGLEPTVICSSRAAIERTPTLDFDLALLDIRMPEIDGIELCRMLASSHPRAYFLLMTAFSSDEQLDAASRSGALAVLPKPLPIAELQRLIAGLPDEPGVDADAKPGPSEGRGL